MKNLICSPSNASLTKYPENTLTKFIHVLPSPIFLDKNKSYELGLRSISLSNNFDSTKSNEIVKKTGYIKVFLNELYSSERSKSDISAKCLARIPCNLNKQENKILNHTFTNVIYLKLLECDEIKELSFTLTDEHNNQLSLSTGPATIIHCEMRESTMNDQFTLTVNPFYSVSEYVTNENNDFKVTFPSELILNGEWEIGIHSIIVPASVHIDDEYLIILYGKNNNSSLKYKIYDIEITTFIDKLNNDLINSGLKVSLEGDEYFFEKMKPECNITGIYMNEMICRYFGIKGKKNNGKFIQFTNKSHIGKSLFSLGTNIDHVCIYSDIVENSIMGNVLAPIMEIVPAFESGIQKKNIRESNIFYIQSIVYRPIAKHVISDIHIQLSSIDGALIPFVPNEKKSIENGISIVFVLRKR